MARSVSLITGEHPSAVAVASDCLLVKTSITTGKRPLCVCISVSIDRQLEQSARKGTRSLRAVQSTWPTATISDQVVLGAILGSSLGGAASSFGAGSLGQGLRRGGRRDEEGRDGRARRDGRVGVGAQGATGEQLRTGRVAAAASVHAQRLLVLGHLGGDGDGDGDGDGVGDSDSAIGAASASSAASGSVAALAADGAVVVVVGTGRGSGSSGDDGGGALAHRGTGEIDHSVGQIGRDGPTSLASHPPAAEASKAPSSSSSSALTALATATAIASDAAAAVTSIGSGDDTIFISAVPTEDPRAASTNGGDDAAGRLTDAIHSVHLSFFPSESLV
ncbi:hypothetical protein TYRP_001752 [Tyrophagus putrescentiae]|nr:hypothetical protein TYRP_001752 [Tyrophagus putrescentiae]